MTPIRTCAAGAPEAHP